MAGSVIVAGARTPIGRLLGGLKDLSAADLGGVAIRGALDKAGVSIATLAQDYAFGRDGVAAFKEALAKTGATLAAEEYAPTTTTDFTAAGQRLFDVSQQVDVGDKNADEQFYEIEFTYGCHETEAIT